MTSLRALPLLFCVPLLAAQPAARSLTLREALAQTLHANLQVDQARESRAYTQAGATIAEGAFDWNLTGSFSYLRQDAATTKALYPLGPYATTEGTLWSRSLGLGLQKPFTWGGSFQTTYTPSYAFSSGTYGDPATGALLGRFNTKAPYSGAFSASYSQALLRGFGRTATEAPLRAARKGSEAADAQFELAMIQLVATTEAQYWDLVYAVQNLANAESALALAEEQLADNRGKVREGTLPEIEITSAEAAVAQQKRTLIAARSQLRNANDTLFRTLYPDENTFTNLVPLDPPEPGAPQVDEHEGERTALAHRPELAVARLRREASGILRAAAENRLLPQLNAYLTYTSTSDTYGAPGPVNGELARGDYPGYGVGLAFLLPLGNRAAKGSLAQARADERLNQLGLQDLELAIRLQVRLAFENVASARAGVEAAREARRFREADLAAEQKKYENGMSTNFFVFAKQNDLNSARATELQARIAYAKAVTALEQAMGTLLQARGFAHRS